MPGVDKECTTHHACDCVHEELISYRKAHRDSTNRSPWCVCENNTCLGCLIDQTVRKEYGTLGAAHLAMHTALSRVPKGNAMREIKAMVEERKRTSAL
jgi:hypothetical protein